MKRILLALAVCYSLKDLKDEGCRVLCLRDFYSSGHSSGKGCACVDQKDSYEGYMTRSMSLGPRPDAPFQPESKSKGQTLEVTIPEDWKY